MATFACESDVIPSKKASYKKVTKAVATPSFGRAPLQVSFDVSSPFELKNNNMSIYWDFDDGTNSTEIYPTHTFRSLGTYIVTLTVTDGLKDTAWVVVIVN
jgi:PKD repeat protein